MENTIKFTPEEMSEIKTIHSEYNNAILLFGKLYLARLELEESFKKLAEKETQAQKEFSSLQDKESKWIESITKKYGEGNLNLQDGTFSKVPTNPS